MAETDLKIKDAPLSTNISGNAKMAGSDGSGLPVAISLSQVYNFVNSGLKGEAYFAAKADVPSKVSSLINDSGFITSTALAPYLKKAELPTNVSAFTNDAGYLVNSDLAPYALASSLPTKVSQLENDSKFATVSQVPTKTSDISNDSGFITIESVPTKTSELENDSDFATVSQIPTKTSDLTNDSGYLSEETDPTVPSWAKQPNKPAYTASEVGALSEIPQANDTTLGGVKLGYQENGKNYPIRTDDTGKAYVNVPWAESGAGYVHPKFTPRDAGLYKITVNDEGHVSDATAVTKEDITVLGIPAQDTVYTHPSYVPREAGLYKVTVDSTGHVSNAAVVAKSDITSLGIPAQDTIYTHPSYTAQANGMYKITVDNIGHVSDVSAITKNDITALGIPAQDTVYTHPSYTARSAGLYKVTVDTQGHVSVATSVTKADITALGIPAQDTTYSAGSGLSFSGTTINHASSVTAGTAGSSSATSGSNIISIPYVTYNATGHITGKGNRTHTINEATTSASGLMSSADKTKMDRLESYTTATTVASLDVNYQTIYVTLSKNASLSASGTGTTYNGRTITAYVYTSSARTITIPTSGNYVSMCGSSFTTTAGGWVEFSLVCISGIWHIAKLEAE